MNINSVTKKHYCLGCGLCVSDVGDAKLAIIEGEDGFPIASQKSGFDGEIENLSKYCPGITIRQNRKLVGASQKLYGPFKEIYVAFSKDPLVRHRGSSGGCITAILCGLIENRIIDGVLHVGPSKQSPLISESVFSTTVEQVIENSGSRYAPCSLLVNLEKILNENDQVAIVGKPCDIAGLKQFLRVYPGYAQKVYCTLSFMCMGMPSQNATSRLAKKLGVNNLKNISNLRYRGHGWPGDATIITKDGNVHKCSYSDSWGKILGRDVLFRCKICPDGLGAFSDISAGDAWYINEGKPSFKEQDGRSLLFCRSTKGREILSLVDNYISIESYDVEDLKTIQPSQYERKNRVWIFYLILKLHGDHLLKFEGLGMWSRIFRCSPFKIARGALGFFKRIPKDW